MTYTANLLCALQHGFAKWQMCHLIAWWHLILTTRLNNMNHRFVSKLRDDLLQSTQFSCTCQYTWGVINLPNRFQVLSLNRFQFHATNKVDGLLTGCKTCCRGSHLGDVSNCLCLVVIFFTFIHQNNRSSHENYTRSYS